MTRTKITLRNGIAALAVTAVLPISMAAAQSADPAMTTAVPIATPTPAPVIEPVVVEPSPVMVSDPLAPAEPAPVSEVAPTAKTETAAKPAARKAASTRTTTGQSGPKAAAVEPAVMAAVGATEAPLAEPIAPPPMAEPLPVVPEVPPVDADAAVYADLLPLAGAAGLGLIAIAALGMMMRRRKPRIQPMDMESHEPTFARETGAPVVAKPVRSTWIPAHPAAKPAFSFGASQPVAATGGNRIEKAMRGPTPDNPFLSLKKRLKRAAFFDQRDRQVRAGLAERVSPMAGLPRRMVETLQASFAQPRTQLA